jgi:hypothetical protein
MAYTFSDQQNKLSSLLGDPNTTSDDMFPVAQRQKELNRGEWQFAVDALDLKEYATGTISSMQIAVPSDFISIFVLIIVTTASQIVITMDNEISLKDWERYYLYQSNRPKYYIWDFSGTKYIKLLGSSQNGQTYYLYYFKKPTTELANSSDTSLHKEEYREAPCFYAAAQLMQQIGKYTQASQFMEQYQTHVNRAKEIVTREFIDVERSTPDFGVNPSVLTDVQGRGYIG